MRHVGHQIPAQAIVIPEPLGHRVECARERADRRRSVFSHASRIIAGGHAIGRLHHGGKRHAHAPQRTRERHHRDDRDSEAAAEQNHRGATLR